MRERGVFTDLNAGLAGKAKLLVSRCDHIPNLLLRHAFAQSVIDGFVCGQSYLASQMHQRQLVGALNHAATRGNWRGAAQGGLWRSFGDSIGEDEADGFFHSEVTACQAAILSIPGPSTGKGSRLPARCEDRV